MVHLAITIHTIGMLNKRWYLISTKKLDGMDTLGVYSLKYLKPKIAIDP